MSKLVLMLTRDEVEQLKRLANRDLRKPQDQARFILRSVLLGDQSQESKNPSAATLPERTANGFIISQPA